MTIAPPQSYQHLSFEVADRLALITMNRPARRNALSLEHMEELIDAFRTDIAAAMVLPSALVTI